MQSGDDVRVLRGTHAGKVMRLVGLTRHTAVLREALLENGGAITVSVPLAHVVPLAAAPSEGGT
ncbi:MAG: hypothetical protein ACRCV9_17655 [Burkholderiaceae bacterium]